MLLKYNDNNNIIITTSSSIKIIIIETSFTSQFGRINNIMLVIFGFIKLVGKF